MSNFNNALNEKEIQTESRYTNRKISETCKYLRIEIKEKVSKEGLKRTEEIWKTEFRNLFIGINTWVVSIGIYSGLFLNLIQELRNMDQEKR